MNFDNGVWLLPTRRRIDQLQAFLDKAVATGMDTPGIIIVQEAELIELQEEYRSLNLPRGWVLYASKAEGMAAKVQEAYEQCAQGCSWIGVLADDMEPITQDWDRLLIEGLNGWNIVTGDDMDQAPRRMESATVFSGDLLRAIGYLAPAGLQHQFFDDCHERLGAATGCLQWNMAVKVAHKPKTYQPGPDSTAQKIHAFHDTDEARFRLWTRDEFAPACEAVFKCAEAHGVQVNRPDLKGVSIYLATPDGEGRLDRLYVRALMQSIEIVRAAGGVIDWAEMPFCADLSLARNRIFGAFLRSHHTHLLMVDDDMGWSPHDVLRLVATGLDFVGGAGPKKRYPLQFCVYSRDDDGREVRGLFYDATQTLEVTGIGTGFLMITRGCAEKIAAAYPELVFNPMPGQTEYAVFDPVIVNKTRFSDDFAFCWRWRHIGGNIHAMPSIKLSHIGSHCFEGSLLEAMLAEREQAAAE